MSRTKDAHLILTMDLRPLKRAFERATRALQGFVEAFTPTGRLRTRRHRHGGNGGDARKWPTEWQSAVCSAWLHEPCPSDAHGLGCSCRCHGERSS